VVARAIHKKPFQIPVVKLLVVHGLSEALNVEEILHRAEQSEKEYDWFGATESYKQALDLLSEDDFSRKGDVTERLGYAFYRVAFSARAKMGEQQEIETLITEEASLFAMFLRNERQSWILRIATPDHLSVRNSFIYPT
jgi:hypothetical protein